MEEIRKLVEEEKYIKESKRKNGGKEDLRMLIREAFRGENWQSGDDSIKLDDNTEVKYQYDFEAPDVDLGERGDGHFNVDILEIYVTTDFLGKIDITASVPEERKDAIIVNIKGELEEMREAVRDSQYPEY